MAEADTLAPFATPQRAVAIDAPAPPVRTVLCVEDNPANLELVEQIIARRTNLRLLGAATDAVGAARHQVVGCIAGFDGVSHVIL